ncbi:MAG: hypothetical protein J6P53_06045, partial [Mailhella sp.]|nr:hypothetical protein [Mailhella sp.]
MAIHEKRALLSALDTKAEEAFKLQSALTAFQALGPDNDGKGEQEKADFVEKWLRAHGLTCITHYDAEDPRVPSGCRPNFVVTIPGRTSRTCELKISVSRNGRTAAYTVRVTLPAEPASGKACYIEYCPFSWFGKPLTSPNMEIASGRGYAAIQYDPTCVASDSDQHEGAYYVLYPYSEHRERQDGVLLA